jgi:hypothetical protein
VFEVAELSGQSPFGHIPLPWILFSLNVDFPLKAKCTAESDGVEDFVYV